MGKPNPVRMIPVLTLDVVDTKSQVVSTNISEMNSRAGEHKSVPVELRLNLGDENTITFGVAGDKGTLVPLSIILKLPFERRDKPYMLTVTFRLRGPLGWY